MLEIDVNARARDLGGLRSVSLVLSWKPDHGMTPRYLVNDDGRPFDAADLSAIQTKLDALSGPDRLGFRKANAKHIAQHAAARMLVVSGPGTGKSFLSRQRIDKWLGECGSVHVLAVSFVRKLVEDLSNDILGDEKLTVEQRKQVEVHTLHRFARSIVERNHGTIRQPLEPHFAIIGGSWKAMVWEDTLTLANQAEENLINAVIQGNMGVLVVGDDDQVLYDKLRSGKADLIRQLYQDPSYAKAMLPFCGRSGYHIVKAAHHFISQRADPVRIAKMFLPVRDG